MFYLCKVSALSHATERFLHAADQRAKQVLSKGYQALYSEPAGFMKRQVHKVQFDIELILSGRFRLVQ